MARRAVVVTISLTGTDGVLARATADAAGAAHARVAIPADAARGDQVLSVERVDRARAFPQQIATVLTVGRHRTAVGAAASVGRVFVLAAMASALLAAALESQRVGRARRPARRSRPTS